MNAKKLFALALSAALALTTLTACGAKEETPVAPAAPTPAASVPTAPTPAPAQLSGTVNLDGSTSMEKVIKVLIESFNETNPNVTLNYNGSGSGAGITAAIDGTADLGLSSRELKAEETAKGAMTLSICIYHFCRCNFSIGHFINFKLFCMSKMLEHLSVFISYCNLHVTCSFLFTHGSSPGFQQITTAFTLAYFIMTAFNNERGAFHQKPGRFFSRLRV